MTCFKFMCFTEMSSTDPKFFGFSEFLTGLALMVLAWTIADFRYRFRIKTAPLPIQKLTFYGMALLGVLTLATDLWRAQEWPVPVGPLTPAIWQSILGAVFLLTFLLWAWFAFIRPPKYGRLNSRRFGQALYRTILNGSPEELAVVADELVRSIEKIVRFGRQQYSNHSEQSPSPKIKKIEQDANDILLIISDPRFCRAIVSSSPTTALAVFEDINTTRKFHLPIETFAKNIVLEAISNKNSFIYHESEGDETGFLGYHKPLTSVMFGNFTMVESIRTLLDPSSAKMMDWDSKQWEAYSRAALLSLKACVTKRRYYHIFFLSQVKRNLISSIRYLNQLDGVDSIEWGNELWRKLYVVVNFIRNAVEFLDMHKPPKGLQIRRGSNVLGESIYDEIAEFMFEVVFAASAVTSPRVTCWNIQNNTVWTDLFWVSSNNGPASKVIHFKFRRLIYNEIKFMNDAVNFKGAMILGYCLNVMGLKIRNDNLHVNKALHQTILSWTKKNFAWLYIQNPKVANACLVEGFSFDEVNSRIIRTSPANGLRREPTHDYFNVDPIQPQESQ